MNYFIKGIKVNRLFHLKDFNIPISDSSCPHLIITGKNGSGKTILLNAVSDFLEKIKTDTSMYFLNYRENLDYWQNKEVDASDPQKKCRREKC